MEFSHILRTLFVLLTVSNFSYSQIESGKVGEEKKIEKEVKKSKAPKVEKKKEQVVFNPSSTQLEFGMNVGMSYRSLSENKSVFGKPMGLKTDEIPLFVSGYIIGIRSQLTAKLHLHFGFSLAQTGEQYRYEQADTLFAYQNKYSNFAVPIGIQYVTGNKLRFIAGIGLQPQLLAKTSRKTQTKDSKKVETSTESTNKKGMQFFTLGSYANLGLEYQVGKKIAVYILPEVRYNLTNTFGKQEPHVHKGQFFGVQFGLSIGIGE